MLTAELSDKFAAQLSVAAVAERGEMAGGYE